MQVTGHLVHFNKIFFLTFLIFIPSISYPQRYPDVFVHNHLKNGIEKIIDQNYDEARTIFNQLDKARRDLPLGKIYLAATEIAESFDYEKPFNHNLIYKYLNEAKKISERRLKENETEIWNNYFIALTEGYTAYYEALNGNWLTAFSQGFKSVSYFEDCLDIDNNFYEALIAVGTFKFWRSKKTEFINWLPFVPDEKENGIELLKKASLMSVYNSYLAVHSLIWIYIEQEEYKLAIELAEKFIKEYPKSRIFKWGLARAYEDIDPNKSVMVYKEILFSYPDDLKRNRINEITLKHLIAQQFVKLRKTDEALILCNEILALNNLNDFEREKLGNRIQRVKQLKSEITSK